MKHPFVIDRNGKLVERKYCFYAGRVFIPEFEIVSNPTIRISDVKRRRFNLIDRTIKQIQKAEDDAIFEVLDSVKSGNKVE